MNLRDLQYLVALDEHRHFGRAADASFVSQPTLSMQLKKLEKELGVPLVERNPGNVVLTEAGRQVADHARVVLGEVDAIRGVARRAADPEAATLRIGLFPTLAPYLLPHVVPKVRRRFPRLELLLVEEKTEEVHRRLREGRLDMGLLALPVDDDHLHAEVLFDEDFVLAVPADHPLAATEGPVDPGVLADQPVLLLEEGHCLRQQALEVCRLAGASEHQGFRATSLETLRQMVAAGVGVTLLPRLSVQPPVPPSTDVRLLRFAEPVPRRRIAALWRPTSVHHELLPRLARVLGDIPTGLATAA
ncbi:MAG TPA: LysR substrate-binding domain-containing protein [Acidimicrobiales bacterium]|nr:LysR substrate-binding domain-containing protein [Acidimicrobiales bacterium]